MDAAKVEIAFWGHIGDISRYPAFLAQFPYLCGCLWVVNGYQDHIGAVEIGGFEVPRRVGDLALSDSVCDFGVEA